MSDTVGTEGVRDTQTGEGASGGATTQVLDALPHPVILVDDKGCIAEANMAAESFFRASAPVMRRHPVSHFVPFGSPLLLLVQRAEHFSRMYLLHCRWIYHALDLGPWTIHNTQLLPRR